MKKSQRLSQAEIRRGCRLMAEAGELGDDPVTWRGHVARELCRLVDASAAFHAEERVTPRREDSTVQGYVILGLDDAHSLSGLIEYEKSGGFHIHPFFPFIAPRATRPWTLTRRQIVGDRDYYGSIVISEYKKTARLDDTIHSRQPLPLAGWANMIALFRRIGDPPFDERERRLVHLVHSEIARLWRRPAAPDPVDALPPRMRQIVEGFRGGEGEKQLAFRLGLTRQTTHTYVKHLYQRIGVSGRFELLDRLAPPPRGLRPRLSYELFAAPPYFLGKEPAFTRADLHPPS